MVETVTAEDSEGLAAVGRLLHDFNAEYDEPAPEPSTLAGLIRTRVRDGNATVLLARDAADDPVGVAVLRLTPSLWSDAVEAYLAELYVVPGRRGQGGRAVRDERYGRLSRLVYEGFRERRVGP